MRGCCFTGHRPEKCGFRYEKTAAEYVMLADELERQLLSALERGFDTFYSGGAKGFDILAAETLIRLREKRPLRIVIVVPYRAQAAGFSPRWRARYNRVLAAADEIVYLSDDYYRGCFEDRNRYMVDRSELVLAHYDGSAGGTRNTINYAKRNGVEVINLGERLKNIFNYSFFDEGEKNG